jgi:hypothetical protein
MLKNKSMTAKQWKNDGCGWEYVRTYLRARQKGSDDKDPHLEDQTVRRAEGMTKHSHQNTDLVSVRTVDESCLDQTSWKTLMQT